MFCGVYIGLGSIYCCIGEYEKVIIVLEVGVKKFLENVLMKVFLLLVKYNVNDYELVMKLLFEIVVKVEEVKEFECVILFYKDYLNEVFK